MSRRITLAYYTTAILLGGLLAALAYYGHSVVRWGAGERWLADVLFVYAVTLVGGFPAQLVNAFLLRRIARALRWHTPGHWLVLGAAVGYIVVWAFAQAGYLIERAYLPAELQRLKAFVVFPFLGPIMFSAQPIPLILAVAAAIALMLQRVQARG